jgi:hypothetical protein
MQVCEYLWRTCTNALNLAKDSERVLAPEARFTPCEGGVRIWDERLMLRPVNTQWALSKISFERSYRKPTGRIPGFFKWAQYPCLRKWPVGRTGHNLHEANAESKLAPHHTREKAPLPPLAPYFKTPFYPV